MRSGSTASAPPPSLPLPPLPLARRRSPTGTRSVPSPRSARASGRPGCTVARWQRRPSGAGRGCVAEGGPRPPHPSQAQGGTRDGPAQALSGQVALITGASRGIGRHLADGLAARGMAVAGLARDEERVTSAMAEVAGASGVRTLAVAADVTDRAAVDAAVARVADELGRVDLLVNNAGMIDAAEVPLWEADPDQWWDVVASHVRGAQLMARAVVPGML